MFLQIRQNRGHLCYISLIHVNHISTGILLLKNYSDYTVEKMNIKKYGASLCLKLVRGPITSMKKYLNESWSTPKSESLMVRVNTFIRLGVIQFNFQQLLELYCVLRKRFFFCLLVSKLFPHYNSTY